MKRLNRARKYRRRRRILYTVILLITAGVIALGFNFKRFQNEYDWLTLKPEQKLNVPLENQLPDLPNGCEVTSLSMLLKYYDINVSKLELSSNIKHVSSFVGNNYRGNPHVGFVGYMSIKNAGWCVYNEPLYNVARKYSHTHTCHTEPLCEVSCKLLFYHFFNFLHLSHCHLLALGNVNIYHTLYLF